MDTQNADSRFRAALVGALEGQVQSRVAEAIGISPQLLSDWKAGRRRPDPGEVFALERHLNLEPGLLSRHLGYLPVDAVREVRDDVAADAGRTIRDYLGDDFDLVLGGIEDFEAFARSVVEDGLRRALLSMVVTELEEQHGPVTDEERRQTREQFAKAMAAPTGLSVT